MGLFPVLAKLPEFWSLLAQSSDRSIEHRPDAVVLIDYPGFNWHVAQMAKTARHSGLLLRAAADLGLGFVARRKVQRYVDHALCKLPFEEAWLKDQGCHATYVGHPYFDELSEQRLDETFLASIATDAPAGW